MNNKIVSVVLVAGIATTGFAGISAANEGKMGKNIENKVDFAESSLKEKLHIKQGEKKYGKRMGMKSLSLEEKQALKSMSDEERKAFFENKRAEKKAQHEERKAIINKLMAGEKLTAAEEATRLEMLAKIEENTEGNTKFSGKQEHRVVIGKLLAGDELTVDEIAKLEEMKAKQAEREAKKALLRPILQKKRAGEELTDEEKQILKDNKSERKGKRGHHGRVGCEHDED